MAQPPPRPAANRAGGPASPAGPGSGSGPRAKEGDKNAPGTFFLGRYRVVDEIGVGGMASVHLARMDGPGGFQKWVAIKRIHPHLVEDDQFVDMFLDEARIAAGINHANVAQVFDLGKDDNTYWIAMEYLHGEPLREVMRRAEERGQRIGPELAARICADAAEGLHAAHELRGKNGQLLGLVHRDVTPHNLFLTYDGYTKVVDFGIAKVADRLSSTRAGTLKGKLAYMSPEQVRGAEVDRTTDIFALGVVLWEITTNQRLFRMDTDLDTLEKVQACIVPPPSTIVPGYPAELEAVLMKALAKRKQDRFQTAREFSRALQQYLVRSGHFVGPEEVATFVRTVFADRIQKREAHLAWAAEVTSTVNVDQLRAGKAAAAGEEASLRPEEKPRPRPAPPPPPAAMPSGTPASGERPKAQIASQSLMDDDEDVPTTVAMREQLEAVLRPNAPRPAAGLPAPPPQQQMSGVGPSPASYAASAASYAANAASYAANAGRPAGPTFAPNPGPTFQGTQPVPPGLPGMPQPRPAFGAPPGPPSPYGQIPQPPQGEDLGSTVALPSNLDPMNRPNPTFGGFGPPPPNAGYGNFPPPQQPQPGPPPQFGGPAPMFGQQQNPQLAPIGTVGGVNMNMPVSHPGGPQSQIETALSLPRPDPHALWLAQQEKQKGERRNTGVLIAIIALAALCVLGIGMLIYFKYVRSKAAVQAATAEVTATAEATSTAAPQAAPNSGASTAPTVATTASETASVTTAVSSSAAQAPAGKASSKEPPGTLSIACKPFCDDILDNGRSIGPSPVTNLPVPPGQHRITLKKGKDTKVISVIVTSGQPSSSRVTM